MACLTEAELATVATQGIGAVSEALLHLADCDACGERLTPLMETSDEPRLGRYEILSSIGKGQYGEVFAAYDPDLDRSVALKRIPTSEAMGLAESIVREAQAMAKINHPNVVTIFEATVAGDAALLSMQLVNGQSLDQWLSRHKHNTPTTLGVLRDVARGVAAAHNAGVIHRDIKPSNVIVDQDGAGHLADFGLASLEQQSKAFRKEQRLSDVTLATRLAGTPAYMAPEVLAGARASQASDVYSLGLLIIDALVGTRPFSEATTLGELEEAQHKPPSASDLHKRGIPRRLSPLLHRCLSVDPAVRPSAETLASALDPQAHERRRKRRIVAIGVVALIVAAVIVGREWVTTDMAQTREERLVRCVARVDRFAEFGEVLSKVDPHMTRGTASGHVWIAAREKLERLSQELTIKGQESCRHTYIDGLQTQRSHRATMMCFARFAGRAEGLLERLQKPAQDNLPALTNVSEWELRQCTNGSFDEAMQAAQVPPMAVIGALEQLLAEVRHGTSLTSQQEATLRAALARQLSKADDRTRRNYEFEFETTVEASKENWPRVEGLAQTYLASDVSDGNGAALGWVTLIESLLKQDKRSEANVAVTAAARVLKRSANEPTLQSRFLYYRARLDFLDGNVAQAEETLNTLITLREQLDDDLSLADALRTLAIVQLNQGKHAESLGHIERASRLTERWKSADAPAVLRVKSTLADVYARARRFDDARRLTADVFARLLPPLKGNRIAMDSQARLTRIAIAQKDAGAARAALGQAQELLPANASSARTSDLQTMKLQINLMEGNAKSAADACSSLLLEEYTNAGQALVTLSAIAHCGATALSPSAALKTYKHGLTFAKRAGAQDWVAWLEIAIGIAHSKSREFAEAIPFLRSGLAGSQSKVPSHLRVNALYHYGGALLNKRKFMLALAATDEAVALASSEFCDNPACPAMLAATTGLRENIAAQNAP